MDVLDIIRNYGPDDDGLLIFEGLNLDALPDESEQLEGVTQLWLTNNVFKDLPTKPLRLISALRVLAMERNKVQSVQALLEKDVLRNVEVLYVDYNELDNVDAVFMAMPQLRWLSARNNSISSLPDLVGTSTRLEGLRLSHNKLQTVPDSIGNLSSLQCLDLEYNKLNSLPHSIGRLTQLMGLLLEGNPNLKYLPMCVMCLSSLSDFSIDPHHRKEGVTERKEVWHYHVHSLLDICCSQVRAQMGDSFEQANIPLELKEKLRTQAQQCHYISCTRCNVFFGEGGMVEKIRCATVCQSNVTLRATYCCSHCACADCVQGCQSV